MTEEHVIHRTLHETFIDPDHVKRSESAEFRKSKGRLKEDGHYKCWVCGDTKNLQCHHRGAEWMFANVVNFDKLKLFLEEWDIYGYSKLLKDRPITSVDDIRNQMYLCQDHHTGVDHSDGKSGMGIHALTFPEWIVQKIAKDGADPIPQAGENAKDVMADIEDAERK